LERAKFSVHDLSEENACCGVCGRPYVSVDYATAVYTDTESIRSSDSVVVSTYYRDFTRRVGGYCRVCDAKQRLKTALIVLACGLLVLVAGILMIAATESSGVPIVLIVAGGFTAFYGFVAALMAAGLWRDKHSIDPSVSYGHFLHRLKKDGLRQSGLKYFSPEEAKSLVRAFW
jgi:hypothetical protein